MKSQSAGILSEKIEEICTMIPALDREIDRRRGKTIVRNDYCKYVFKNGSYIDNMTAGEKSRGKRRQGKPRLSFGQIFIKILLKILYI